MIIPDINIFDLSSTASHRYNYFQDVILSDLFCSQTKSSVHPQRFDLCRLQNLDLSSSRTFLRGTVRNVIKCVPHVQHVCLSNGNERDIKEINSRHCIMTSQLFQPFITTIISDRTCMKGAEFIFKCTDVLG